MVGSIVLSLLNFIGEIPNLENANDTSTEAIVVLTGGSERLEEGLNLLSERKAKKLFISGVYRGVEVSRLLALFQGNPNELIFTSSGLAPVAVSTFFTLSSFISCCTLCNNKAAYTYSIFVFNEQSC